MRFLKIEVYYTENCHFLIFGSGCLYQMQSLILTPVQRNNHTAFLHQYLSLKVRCIFANCLQTELQVQWEALTQQAWGCCPLKGQFARLALRQESGLPEVPFIDMKSFLTDKVVLLCLGGLYKPCDLWWKPALFLRAWNFSRCARQRTSTWPSLPPKLNSESQLGFSGQKQYK